MPYEPSWIRPPDFLGASEAGYRLGLSRQQMLEQADQHAAELSLRADELRSENARANAQRTQEQNNFNAGESLKQAALKQQGLFHDQEVQNVADRNNREAQGQSARDALEQSRFNYEKNKPLYENTGGGLFKIDPVTGEASEVAGTSKSERLPTPIAPKTEIRQVLNPARVHGGEVDTDAPAYLSLTNQTAGSFPLMSSPANSQPQGIRVRNKKTGQMGTQLSDGSVVPDGQ